jgi:hypothetical protein
MQLYELCSVTLSGRALVAEFTGACPNSNPVVSSLAAVPKVCLGGSGSTPGDHLAAMAPPSR